jgi:hypothetical protein
VLRQRAEQEASNPNAEAEDREIEAMMKGFAPVPSSVIADARPFGTLDAPTFQLKTLVSGSLHLSTRSAPFVGDAGAARAAPAERQALSPSNAGLGLLESLRRKPVRSAADSGAVTPAADAGSATPAPQAIAEGTGTAALPVVLSGMTGADVAKEIGGVKADFVLDHVDLLLDGDARAYERAAARAELGGAGSATSDDDGDEHVGQGDTAAVDDTQKSRAPKPEVRADELVITRLLGTNQRTVSRMDASATYIGVLLSALKFAPSEYTVLVLDADALAGRRAALGRQAAAAGISSFWDEVAQCTCPSVTIVQCNPPFAGDGTIAASNGDDVPIRQAPMHLTLLQARSDARQTTIDAELARRREAEDGPRTESELATMRNRDVTRLVVDSYRGAVSLHRAQLPKIGENPPLKASQHPGIVAALARGDVAGERVDLVNNGTVRAYASTMLPSCKVDALVQPFYDSHSPSSAPAMPPGSSSRSLSARSRLPPPATPSPPPTRRAAGSTLGLGASRAPWTVNSGNCCGSIATTRRLTTTALSAHGRYNLALAPTTPSSGFDTPASTAWARGTWTCVRLRCTDAPCLCASAATSIRLTCHPSHHATHHSVPTRPYTLTCRRPCLATAQCLAHRRVALRRRSAGARTSVFCSSTNSRRSHPQRGRGNPSRSRKPASCLAQVSKP